LTPEQVWLFRLIGFVKLPEPLPPETLAALKERIDADVSAEIEPVVRDTQGRVVRLSRLLDRDPLFHEVATSPQVLDPLRDLLGPDIEIATNIHNHANLRRPDAGDDHFHRDVPHWTRGLVTVLFYLEEASAERGCTQLVPGSHLLPWSMHRKGGFDAVAGGRLVDQVVRAESPAGGMLAIDSLLWHAVGPNKTTHSRTTITIGYHAADTLTVVDDPALELVSGERHYTGNRSKESFGGD
jgi:ectoine hydroxylase-related dioxygenase (phytanoyl-CoA dioxygenase family)